MDSKEIIRLLQRYFYDKQKRIQIVEYRGLHFQNPDLLVICPKMIATEIEVKISRADFKKEFKSKEYKHNRLKLGLTNNQYFYFAVPDGLIKVDEVPDYCGLIYVNQYGCIKVVKKCKKLNDNTIQLNQLISLTTSLTARNIFGHSYMKEKAKNIEDRKREWIQKTDH